MKKIVRLTETDLTRIVKRVLNEQLVKQPINEGNGQGGYKVGRVFDEVHNRQFIMSLNYSGAGRGSSDTYNDFEFRNPKVVSVGKDGLILKITSGFYNPNDVYKSGQKYDNLSDFCLRIPYHSIQEVRENQLMVSIPNNYVDLYLDKGCTEYNAKLAANTEKAKKCGHTSWEAYKKSNWSCNGKSGQVGMNTKECLKKAGFVIGTVGGPQTRRNIYEKIFQGSTYQIDITGTDTPKKELRVIKKGTTPQVCSSWSCDSSKPLGIKFSGCVSKELPRM
jgi:hypothetical protein